MAIGINKVILVGHLGRDPEIHTFNDGTKKASFSLATTESYKNRDGQKVDQTEWHNIVLWRGLAEVAEKYLHKGDLVYLEGKIKRREYEENGQKKYFFDIQCDTMSMLSGKKDAPASGSAEPAGPTSLPELPPDDLPF